MRDGSALRAICYKIAHTPLWLSSMDPALPPKPQGPQVSLLAKAVAARKKLLMGLGAGVVIWFAVLRPSPRPQFPSRGVAGLKCYRDTPPNPRRQRHCAHQPHAPLTIARRTEPTRREISMLDSPDEVAPDEEFHIQVSLTEQQLGPELKSMSGQVTPEGKLAFSLPQTQDNTLEDRKSLSWQATLNSPGEQSRRASSCCRARETQPPRPSTPK